MKRARRIRLCGAAIAVTTAAVPGLAQELSGVPGSPGATTTIDGRQLPPPPQKFGGKIEAQRRAVEALLAGAGGAA